MPGTQELTQIFQVQQIAGSIREFGFTNPVLIGAENDIIAGHGRVLRLTPPEGYQSRFSDMTAEISQTKLAEIYGIPPSQLSRLKTAEGIDLTNPDDMLRALSVRLRPGIAFDRLSAPNGIENARQAIAELSK